MATNSDKNVVKVRVFVRVSIPEMDVRGVPDLQAAIQEIVNRFEGAELELSMNQPRPTPQR
jgi:hypothetical protein